MNKITRFKLFYPSFRRLASLAVLLAANLYPAQAAAGLAVSNLASPNAAETSTRYYVDQYASGLDNGSDWPNAFNDLQDALDVVVLGDEIWVAAGVYTPSKQTAEGYPRTVTFKLADGVKIYGGFEAGQTDLDQRQWRVSPSVLDCDVNGDDNGFTNNGENCYHVVTASGIILGQNTLLDGFTIRGGNANGSSQDARGGGIYNSNGSPSIQNVIFTYNNASQQGGGIYNSNSQSVLIGAFFYKNTASFGAGLYNQGSDTWVVNSLFSGNTAGTNGGGIQNTTSNPILINSVFSSNTAQYGGAIYNNNSDGEMHNLTIWNNQASGYQGGGGISNFGGSDTGINNVIIWENTNGQIFSEPGSNPLIYKSLIQGGCPIPSCSGTILDSDPKFVDPYGPDTVAGTLDDNLRLKADSPAIDNGDNNRLPDDALDLDNDGHTTDEELPIDADGRPRSGDMPFVADGPGEPPIVDLGAYESRILFVDASATGGNNGFNWANAFTTLQAALEASFYGDSVWVADGVYKPTERTDPGDARSATFAIRNGTSVYGGFASGETSPTQRNLNQNASVLSGDLDGDDIGFTNNDENSYHVVRLVFTDASTRLDGFRIQGGNADIEFADEEGGGIFTNTSNSILANLTLYQNYARSGGGVYNSYGDLLMINCKWIDNQAIFGGGLRNFIGSPRLVNALFSGNSSIAGGGGAYNSFGAPTFTNTTFSNNQADEQEVIDEDGDGILNDFGAILTLDNSIVWDNQDIDQQVSNAGIDTETDISFSIIQGGCPGGSGFICLSVLDSNPQFKDTDGQDDLPGTLDDDFSLQEDSPAKDVGENSRLPLDEADLNGDGDTSELLPFDLDWNDRTIGDDEPPRVDLGALEIPFPTIYLPLVIKS